MDRTAHVLQQLQQLHQVKNKSRIDIDLMLDYTRVLYADLLEQRDSLSEERLELPKQVLQPVTKNAAADETILEAHKSETILETEPIEEPNEVSTPAVSIEENTKQVLENIGQDQKGISFEPPSGAQKYSAENLRAKVEEPVPVQKIPVPSTTDQQQDVKATPAAIQGFTLPKDIRKAVGINDKYLYLNELFHNHKSNYEETMDRLSGLDNYKQAEDYLWAGIAKENNWSKEDPTIENFFTMIQQFFASR